MTTDGTADNPYQSPSQADDGTIVTVRAAPNNGPLIRMRQNGSVINQIKVPVAQYGPFEPSISPDGRYVAYETAYRDTMGNHSEAHYANAEGVTAPGTYPLGGPGTGSPSWIDATHAFLGNYTQALTQVPGQQPVQWWHDWDLQPSTSPPASTSTTARSPPTARSGSCAATATTTRSSSTSPTARRRCRRRPACCRGRCWARSATASATRPSRPPAPRSRGRRATASGAPR